MARVELHGMWVLLGILSLSCGCALCAAPDDGRFGAYGGTWQRDDPCTGRVGSTFDPAGTKVLYVDDQQPTPAEQFRDQDNDEPEALPPGDRDRSLLKPESDFDMNMEPDRMDPDATDPDATEPLEPEPMPSGDPDGADPAVPGGSRTASELPLDALRIPRPSLAPANPDRY